MRILSSNFDYLFNNNFQDLYVYLKYIVKWFVRF